jgi:hypothetical protein
MGALERAINVFGENAGLEGHAARRILPSGIWMLRVALGGERPHSSPCADLIGDCRQRAGRRKTSGPRRSYADRGLKAGSDPSSKVSRK